MTAGRICESVATVSGVEPQRHRPARSSRPLLLIGSCVSAGTFLTGIAALALCFVAPGFMVNRWPLLVLPAFVLNFAVHALTIFEARRRNSIGKGHGLLMRGWRRFVAPLPMLVFFVTLFTAGVSGSAERVGDRYIINDHGRITEISRAGYDRSRLGAARLFAGGVVAFGGTAALYLSQCLSDDRQRGRLTIREPRPS